MLVFRAKTLWGFGQWLDDHRLRAGGVGVPLYVDGAWDSADESPVAEHCAGHTVPFAATRAR